MTVNEANFQECTLSISGVTSTRVDDNVTAITHTADIDVGAPGVSFRNLSVAIESCGLLLLDDPTWIQPHDQFGPINAQAESDWVRTQAKAATSIPYTCLECLLVLSHEIEHNPAGISSDFHGVTKAAQRLD